MKGASEKGESTRKGRRGERRKNVPFLVKENKNRETEAGFKRREKKRREANSTGGEDRREIKGKMLM